MHVGVQVFDLHLRGRIAGALLAGGLLAMSAFGQMRWELVGEPERPKGSGE